MNSVCHICDKHLSNQRCPITQSPETAYFHYFRIKIKNLVFQMIWSEPSKHASMIVTFPWPFPSSMLHWETKRSLVCSEVAPPTRPVPHGTYLSILQPTEDCQQDSDTSSQFSEFSSENTQYDKLSQNIKFTF